MYAIPFFLRLLGRCSLYGLYDSCCVFPGLVTLQSVWSQQAAKTVSTDEYIDGEMSLVKLQQERLIKRNNFSLYDVVRSLTVCVTQ